MWTALAGLPGKLKVLLDRLSATRANNLDNLNATVSSRMPGSATEQARIDTAISSRAPASTALSNAVWTDAKAGYVDAAISSRAPASTALSNAVWTNARGGYLDRLDTDVSSRAPASTALSNAVWTNARGGYLDKLPKLDPLTLPPVAGGLSLGDAVTGQPVYAELISSQANQFMSRFTNVTGNTTVLNVTGKGVLNYLAVGATAIGGTRTVTGTVTVTIDGVPFSQYLTVTSTTAAAYVTCLFVGGYPRSFDQIPFHESLVINVNMTSDPSTGNFSGTYNYRKVA